MADERREGERRDDRRDHDHDHEKCCGCEVVAETIRAQEEVIKSLVKALERCLCCRRRRRDDDDDEGDRDRGD